MKEITYLEACGEAMIEEMTRDETIFYMSEGAPSGVWVTPELFKRFGPERVRDVPLSESGFTGTAFGAAIAGMRPVIHIMFNDFVTVCMDPIVNQGANLSPQRHRCRFSAARICWSAGCGCRSNSARAARRRPGVQNPH